MRAEVADDLLVFVVSMVEWHGELEFWTPSP